MKREQAQYESWLQADLQDPNLTAELVQIKGDMAEIHDRFYQELAFGTAGIRGVMGAGTNRMNLPVIRRTTQGFGNVLKRQHAAPTVAIGYDSRNLSEVFAREAACVFAANGIKVHLFPELMPVPCLSFAIRALFCQAGVMMTASHNPAAYNGYKAYGSDGCQLSPEDADLVLAEMQQIDVLSTEQIHTLSFEKAQEKQLIELISEQMLVDFLEAVQVQALHPEVSQQTDLRVVYTPLNGAGNKPVRMMLSRMGVKDLHVVPEQEHPDGNFPTCPYPNPEVREALALGLQLAAEKQADLLLATDPDADRIGIAAPDQAGNYRIFSGNEIGILLMEYICAERLAQGSLPEHPVVVSTVVSTYLIDRIAKRYGVEVRRVLTGFKYIGEQIHLLEEAGTPERYLFGFEESFGYLIGIHARDKDAVGAAMMLCDMAAFLKAKGMTVVEFLTQIYETYGYYYHTQESFYYEGSTGMEQMEQIMQQLDASPPTQLAKQTVERVDRYMHGVTTECDTGKTWPILLPRTKMLCLHLPEQASVIIRPSGTEPKIKVYYTTVSSSEEAARGEDAKLKTAVSALLHQDGDG